MSKVFDFSIVGISDAEGMAFQSMLVDELSPGSLIAVDRRGLVFGWNEQLFEVFGYSRKEMLGRDLSRIMAKTDFKAHQAGMKHFLDTGESRILGKRIEVTAVHKDGHSFSIELNVSRVFWHNEPFFLGRVRDITERVEFERSLLALTGNKPLDHFDPIRFRAPEDQLAMETKQAAFFSVRDAVERARKVIEAEPAGKERAEKVEKILGRRNVPLTLALAVLRSA